MKRFLSLMMLASSLSVFANESMIPITPHFTGGSAVFSSESVNDDTDVYTMGPLFIVSGQYSFANPPLMSDSALLDRSSIYFNMLGGKVSTNITPSSVNTKSEVTYFHEYDIRMVYTGLAKSEVEIKCVGGKPVVTGSSSVTRELDLDYEDIFPDGTENQIIEKNIDGKKFKITFNEVQKKVTASSAKVIRNAIKVERIDGNSTFKHVLGHTKASAVCK